MVKPERKNSTFNHLTPIFVLSLFLIGLLLHVFTVVVALKHPMYTPYRQLRGDMATYISLAISLARGEGYSDRYDESNLKDFFKDPEHVKPTIPAKPTAKKAIGYPLFLAIIFRMFGYHLTPILFIQAILSVLSLPLIYAIGRQVGSQKVALIALAIAVFYYPFWYKAVTILVETLLTFLTLLFIYGLIRWFTKPSLVSGFLTGLAGGLSFLVKPIILPTIPLYLLWGYFRFRRQGIRRFMFGTVALICGLTLVVAPWAIRNYRHSGRLLLTPTFGGYQFLLLYNNYNLNFLSYSAGFLTENYPGFRDSVMPSLKVNLPDSTPPLLVEYLQDQAYARYAIKFIITHPKHFFKALLTTFWNMWRIDYPNAILLRKMSNLIFYAGMIPFFFFGIYTAVRKRNIPALLIAIFFGYFVAFHIILASMLRHRITVMPLFFVLSAVGLTEVWQEWRSRTFRNTP